MHFEKSFDFLSKFQQFLSAVLDSDPIVNTDSTIVQSRRVYYAELPTVHVFLQLLMSHDQSVYRTEAEFLDEIQTKLTDISTALPIRFLFLQLTQPLTTVYEIHREISSLRSLKIMPRNLNEIVCSLFF